MFNFTTENVLNDLSRVSSAAGSLTIARLNKFLAAGVTSCYKRPYTPPAKDSVAITPTDTVPGAGTYRLALDIRLSSGSQRADYNRYAVNKGKPVYAEFEVSAAQGATPNALVTALANPTTGILRYFKKNGQNVDLSTITSSGTAPAGTLTITVVDEYQRVVSARLEKYNATTGEYDLITGGAGVVTAGTEGFGTAWQITKNLRIPTVEATRFMGEHSDELPVANGTYVQYTLAYEQDRNVTGGYAVGEKTRSATTHVLYVRSTDAATFDTHLATATITKTDITA